MCGIAGMVGPLHDGAEHLEGIFRRSSDRGRDAWGIVGLMPSGLPILERGHGLWNNWMPDARVHSVIANFRAEPITEWMQTGDKPTPQPYGESPWWIAHNGTIANDRELADMMQVAPNPKVDSAIIPHLLRHTTPRSLHELAQITLPWIKGSYGLAILNEQNPNELYLATNYKPIWLWYGPCGNWFFASQQSYLPATFQEPSIMLPPYSACWLFPWDEPVIVSLRPAPEKKRALVVCSGGLDSTVSAAWAKANGYEVTLLHFLYGCRAEGPETLAIEDIAKAMEVDHVFLRTDAFRTVHSALFNKRDDIVGGEAGAEFAHEWVPARNLVMLSIAAAHAESNGFSHIVLGNNLEEAGAYPDNEMEFINRFNAILPFALADGKHVQTIMPVGNLMKSEIIKLGLELKAPLDKTWSCYRSGELHCGTCGPCIMRRKSFEKLGVTDPIQYAK